MTTIGGERCDGRQNGERCTKNLGHHSEHRFPMGAIKPAGRTLAQALGNVATCNVQKVLKGDTGVAVTHRCRKPKAHSSNHHSGGFSWA